MNIAIISHSAGGGGAERVAVNLANHLLNENEVFFCAVHSDRREYYLDPKVQYDYIGTERSGFRGQLSIAINLRKYIKKRRKRRRDLKVVHINQNISTIAIIR